MYTSIPEAMISSRSMSWSFLHIGARNFRPRSPQTRFILSHW